MSAKRAGNKSSEAGVASCEAGGEVVGSRRIAAQPIHKHRKKANTARGGYVIAVAIALVALVSMPAKLGANELKLETQVAWDNYIRTARLRAEQRTREGSFLLINDLPEKRRNVQAGATLVWREGPGHPATVPHGLIHDWMGAIFIPNATIADVLAVVRDYRRYPEVYKPAVIEAKDLGAAGESERFSMLLMQKVLFVTAAMTGEYEARYVQVDAKRWYGVSKSTRLQAIENFGQPEMRVLPAGQGPGYVWRLYSFTRFEESDGGVYIEMEALGLSRDVPMMLRWLVDPIVERLPRSSMHATLEETRKAVLDRIRPED